MLKLHDAFNSPLTYDSCCVVRKFRTTPISRRLCVLSRMQSITVCLSDIAGRYVDPPAPAVLTMTASVHMELVALVTHWYVDKLNRL